MNTWWYSDVNFYQNPNFIVINTVTITEILQFFDTRKYIFVIVNFKVRLIIFMNIFFILIYNSTKDWINKYIVKKFISIHSTCPRME